MFRRGKLALTLFAALAAACSEAPLNVLGPVPDSSVHDALGTEEAANEGAADAALRDATPMEVTDAFVQDVPVRVDAPVPSDAACGQLLAIGDPCVSSGQCCSGLCALDPTQKQTCRPTPGCLGDRSTCSSAAACCSLACVPGDAGAAARVCGDAPSCVSAGGACMINGDCCGNACVAGACAASTVGCRPAGEACGGNGDCCSSVCAGAMVKRCALLQGCRVVGEICAAGSDCCSATCTLDTNGTGHCAAPASCISNDGHPCIRTLDDLCGGDGDCCSRRCLPTSDGVHRCAPLSGCLPSCEPCTSAAECCSGVCAAGADAQGLRRCQAATCGQAGEICSGNPQCCSGEAALMCIGDPKSLGANRCLPGPPCAAAASGCALASQCCGGQCIPGSTAGPTCSATCVADGLACTTRADCCGATSDCLLIGGVLACTALIH